MARIWAWGITTAIAAASICATFAGCGSDAEEVPGGTVEAGTGDATGFGDGAAFPDGNACKTVGASCAANGDCCSLSCDPTLKVCAKTFGKCLTPGEACKSGPECCTYACVGGKCSGTQCIADNAACVTNEECCGGACDAGKCKALSGSCKTSGNPCAANGECCSKLCKDGKCDGAPSYCIQNGDVCVNDVDCCGGKCTKAGTSALGLCEVSSGGGSTGCTNAGQLCGDGATYTGGDLPNCGGECCSRSCRPYAPTGVLICQPPSGCHPTGELCVDDKDCCGSATLPDGDRSKVTCSKASGATVGRCDNGNACSPAGAICRLQSQSCNANANCCAGNVLQKNTCKQDSLGIPRCLAAEVDCTADPSTFAGKACASSADCCNLPCVPNPAGTPPFVCVTAKCVPSAGACTTTADCCSGLPCVIAPGATSGVCGSSTGGTPPPGGSTPPPATNCAAYGQQCTAAGDCCNNVPCTNGYCVVPVR